MMPGAIRRLQNRSWSSPRYTRLLLLTCLAGLFASTFTFTVVTVALKAVANDLHSTPNVVAWVVTAPALAIALSIPIFGRLGDEIGHRKVYLIGLAVAVIFSLVTAAATNALWLISARTVAQLAGTATMPASYAMLLRHFPPHERVRATAWANGTTTTAAVTGLVIGGPTISAFGWRPLFVTQALLGVLALIPAVIVLKPDVRKHRVPLDCTGAFLLAVTLFCLTFGINRLAAGGPSALSVSLLAVFPVALFLLWTVERRKPMPLLPLRLVSNPEIQSVAGASALLGLAYLGSFVITPLLLQSVFGLSVTVTSLITACRTLSVAAAAPVAGRLGVRFGERRLLVGASLGVASGMLLLAFGSHSKVLAIVVLALVLTGWANGHANPAAVAMVANSVDQQDFGLATSLQQMASQVGSVAGIGLFTAIAANAVSSGPFTTAFVIAAGLTALIPPLIHLTRQSRSLAAYTTTDVVEG